MTGDGILDVIITNPNTLYIYENKLGKKSTAPVLLGTEPNFTLY
jgi:hypothetical protein